MEQFSSELIAVLGVGIAVIGLVLEQGRRFDRRINALAMRMDERDRRTDERFRQSTDQTNERFRQLTDQMKEKFRQQNEQMNELFRNLSERVARVEGRFDLLDTFVDHRKEPSAEAAE